MKPVTLAAVQESLQRVRAFMASELAAGEAVRLEPLRELLDHERALLQLLADLETVPSELAIASHEGR